MEDHLLSEEATSYDNSLSTPQPTTNTGSAVIIDPRGPHEAPKALCQEEQQQVGPGLILVHGYLHKQGERVIKGPIHKSWKRRYFALEKSKMFYFQTHLDCRQYFSTRNVDLVVGAVDLKGALSLRPSARLDLPHKGFEVVTKRRVWVRRPLFVGIYYAYQNSFDIPYL